jgi:glycosyltransferase involved in cell wall biosynthesis
MKITVVLCTYNRCHSLATALASVAASELPNSVEWEVLIVDNNSTDQTRAVVESFCQKYPARFRYLFEAHQGKSYALNSGIRAACGDVLAFMDDDVTVDPKWLQNISADLLADSCVGVGGRILPDWPCVPPSWLPSNTWYGMAPLVMFDMGPEAGPLNAPPFGTNMAFHRRVFEKYGAFRTDLGPRPKSEIRNEDTEFGNRLLAAGEQLRYEPKAVVRHVVPQERLRQRFFLRWWFDKGRANVRESGVASDTKWVIGGIPLHLFRRLAAGTIRWLITFEPSRRFAYRLTVYLVAGIITESYIHRSGTTRKKDS